MKKSKKPKHKKNKKGKGRPNPMADLGLTSEQAMLVANAITQPINLCLVGPTKVGKT